MSNENELDPKGMEAALNCRPYGLITARNIIEPNHDATIMLGAAITAYLAAARRPILSDEAVERESLAGLGDELLHCSTLLLGSADTNAPYIRATLHRIAVYLNKLTAAFSTPPEPAYRPQVIHYDGEGDPYWQFVERDTATVTGVMFAANVEKLTDFDGKLIGFNVYEPAPSSPVPVEAVGWQPIETANRSLTARMEFPGIPPASYSHPIWCRFERGAPFEASWVKTEDGKEYWWAWDLEDVVDPDEWMPHPLALPAAPAHREAGE